jgi:hypothetical protein
MRKTIELAAAAVTDEVAHLDLEAQEEDTEEASVVATVATIPALLLLGEVAAVAVITVKEADILARSRNTNDTPSRKIDQVADTTILIVRPAKGNANFLSTDGTLAPLANGAATILGIAIGAELTDDWFP